MHAGERAGVTACSCSTGIIFPLPLSQCARIRMTSRDHAHFERYAIDRAGARARSLAQISRRRTRAQRSQANVALSLCRQIAIVDCGVLQTRLFVAGLVGCTTSTRTSAPAQQPSAAGTCQRVVKASQHVESALLVSSLQSFMPWQSCLVRWQRAARHRTRWAAAGERFRRPQRWLPILPAVSVRKARSLCVCVDGAVCRL